MHSSSYRGFRCNKKKQTKNKYKFLNKKNYILFQTPQLCNFQDLLISHKKSTKEYDDESSLLDGQRV